MINNELSFSETVRLFYLNHEGKKISYGIGCAWLGRSKMDEDTVKREASVLRTAYDLGFRYYDTSAAYGDSEVIVGEFVAQVPREDIFLASKSRVPETATAKEARDYVLRGLDRSLLRMKTDHLDLFQIHDVENLTQVLASDGVLEGLLEVMRKGTIRYIGLATRNHHLLETAVKHGSFDTILTYSDYTPLDQSAGRLIKLANEHRVGVVNASPLSSGLLTGVDPRGIDIPNHPEFTKRRNLATELYVLCRDLDINILGLALHFPTLNPCIDISLTGPASVEELKTTFQALMRPVSPDDLEAWTKWNEKLS